MLENIPIFFVVIQYFIFFHIKTFNYTFSMSAPIFSIQNLLFNLLIMLLMNERQILIAGTIFRFGQNINTILIGTERHLDLLIRHQRNISAREIIKVHQHGFASFVHVWQTCEAFPLLDRVILKKWFFILWLVNCLLCTSIISSYLQLFFNINVNFIILVNLLKGLEPLFMIFIVDL